MVVKKFSEKSRYLYNMLIVNIENTTQLERALKSLKNKVLKTKQNEILRGKKEYVKKSVARRTQLRKAIGRDKFINSR